MRPPPAESFPHHCLRCLLRREACLCARIPRVETSVRFVIVQHTVERLRASNTGRLAALSLPGSELLEYGGPDPLDPSVLEGAGTWLLYPGAAAPVAPGASQAPPPRRLVVLDGTWHQSRKMIARLAPLRSMPRLALSPPDPDLPRLRRPPRPDGMSTIEAIAAAVALLEGEEKARPLLELHAEHYARIQALKGIARPAG